MTASALFFLAIDLILSASTSCPEVGGWNRPKVKTIFLPSVGFTASFILDLKSLKLIAFSPYSKENNFLPMSKEVHRRRYPQQTLKHSTTLYRENYLLKTYPISFIILDQLYLVFRILNTRYYWSKIPSI